MKPINTPHSQHPAPPAPRRLALKKETLRRLTPAALRLAAGGARTSTNDPTAC
jgi:hypothetical protein